MNNIEIYFLKVNIAIALFYLIYRFAIANDTFWTARRFYLLSTTILAVVYPFISLAGWLEKQETVQVFMSNYVNLKGLSVNASPTSILTFRNIVYTIYLFAVTFFMVRMCIQLVSIFRWKMKSKSGTLFGTKIVEVAENITPFSFFNLIFINPSLHTEAEARQILAHEQTHAHQMHSLDVMLGELLTIACWFNPAAWLLKREIRQNLEFLADNNVLQSGFDAKNYQYHLLQLSYQIPTVPLVNKFNVLPIKKRIIMMNQQKTAKAGLLKYSLIVPLVIFLVFTSNAESFITTAKEVFKTTNDSIAKPLKKVETTLKSNPQSLKNKVSKQNNKGIYTIVEKMPQFLGGDVALLNYLSQNIHYPEIAKKNNVQGKVILRFVVSSTGKVEKVEVVRGVSAELDNEAIRVVKTLPDFTPGEQKGKRVAVWYTLPITFKLDGDSKTPKGFDSKNPPVILLDGKRLPNGFDLNSIDVQTIASLNVLKPDTEKKKAEYIAQYGYNAENGVILIKTKK